MTISNVSASRNRVARFDGTTYQERIGESFDAHVARVAELQGLIEHYEEHAPYVPADILEDYETATESLEVFADQWGFDC